MQDPIILINHPVKRTMIQGRVGRYDNHSLDETKECQVCSHLRKVVSTQKTGYRLCEEHLSQIIGVCTWNYWKIVWRRDKPKKCMKLSAKIPETIQEITSNRFIPQARYKDEDK